MFPLANLHQENNNAVSYRLAQTGYVLLVIIAVILFLAVSNPSRSNFALFFAFSLISFGLVSIWLTIRNIRGLIIEPEESRYDKSTRPLRFSLVVRNPTSLSRSALALKLGKQTLNSFSLDAHSHRQLLILFKHHGRGHYQLDQLSLTTDYPLGIMTVCLPLKLVLHAWVLPTTDQAISKPPPNVEYLRGENNAIDSLRDYTDGDPINRIHWQSFAKTGKLAIKAFANEQEEQPACQQIWLDWSTIQGNAEDRIQSLVAMMDWAMDNRIHYGLRLEDTEIAMGSGIAHYYHCLKELAIFRCPQEALGAGLMRCGQRVSMAKGHSL